VSHLPATHLVMEVVALAMERCLAHEHPLYAFLSTHFKGTYESEFLAIIPL
jgi:hypothetical protein